MNTTSPVAGTNSSGSASDRLSFPTGIFVTQTLNLYVADSGNHRVQLFLSGQMNATTVAGSGAPRTITLNVPVAVMLDGNGYLFICDFIGHRIIGSGADGFRCIPGCTSGTGSASDQLDHPWSFSFDSDGNLFVADSANNRIQKFVLDTNSCGESLELISGIFL